MANTKKNASADAAKNEAASTEAAAKKETAAKADEKKTAAKRGRKPAAAKTETKTEAKKPGRKPAAAKTETKPAAKKPGRKPAAAKTEKAAPAASRKGGKKNGISYEEIVTAARKKLLAADTTKITRPIAANVELTGTFTENQTPEENGSNKNVFYIAINPEGPISVEPYRYNDNDISIYADAEELLNVLKGKKNIYDALADGNIHIHGTTKKAILLIHAGF